MQACPKSHISQVGVAAKGVPAAPGWVLVHNTHNRPSCWQAINEGMLASGIKHNTKQKLAQQLSSFGTISSQDSRLWAPAHTHTHISLNLRPAMFTTTLLLRQLPVVVSGPGPAQISQKF